MLFIRALLALAAAPLLAARAPRPADDYACTTKMKGSDNGKMITLPTTTIPAHDSSVQVDIPNNCARLIGERVKVCDYDVAPEVDMDEWPKFTPVTIIRKGAVENPADIYIDQFCQ